MLCAGVACRLVLTQRPLASINTLQSESIALPIGPFLQCLHIPQSELTANGSDSFNENYFSIFKVFKSHLGWFLGRFIDVAMVALLSS
jgi:hypothetical protein